MRSVHAMPVLALLLAASATLAQEPSTETLEMGKRVFTEEAEPSCTACHTLKDADATGEVGPDLDELQPTADVVRAAVTNGLGIMPAYRDVLSEEQIAAVSAYVASVAGQSR